eukprot:CAMPEP_0119138414 /NCGR_PEP_ID=MMETSP1310-20130426/25606_1 /TAXON_ID=464262 /ORGANISM="Genus nov. species nov., Strain RCC2339" /LENGTH=206 /DNA_ID=CAMNT_0007129601 /DNA_START=69 /DNA_END=685 /DNA_ORIENTATION=+
MDVKKELTDDEIVHYRLQLTERLIPFLARHLFELDKGLEAGNTELVKTEIKALGLEMTKLNAFIDRMEGRILRQEQDITRFHNDAEKLREGVEKERENIRRLDEELQKSLEEASAAEEYGPLLDLLDTVKPVEATEEELAVLRGSMKDLDAENEVLQRKLELWQRKFHLFAFASAEVSAFVEEARKQEGGNHASSVSQADVRKRKR